MEIKLLQYWRQIQRTIFPGLEEELGPQTPMHGAVMVALDFLNVDSFIYQSFGGKGRPSYDRRALFSAFVAKTVLNLTTTDSLIDRLKIDKVLRRLCGFDPTRRIPCKATFSNAFAEFSLSQLPSKIHEAIVKATFQDKIVGHVSRDSTDIAARGKVAKVPKHLKGKRKPRAKGKKRRIYRQLGMNLKEMIDDLPINLDCGSKRGHTWKGFKLHLDVADGGIPLSAIVTSASVHDSQAAIPLEEMTSQRVTSLYSLMDSAYDAIEIRTFVTKKDKVAIIEPHNRSSQKRAPLDPAERNRFRERTTVERAYSRLKDGLGARQIRVKEPLKVTAHLMLGVLVLTVEQAIRVFT